MATFPVVRDGVVALLGVRVVTSDNRTFDLLLDEPIAELLAMQIEKAKIGAPGRPRSRDEETRSPG